MSKGKIKLNSHIKSGSKRLEPLPASETRKNILQGNKATISSQSGGHAYERIQQQPAGS